MFTSRLRHAHVIHMLDKVAMLSMQSLSKAHRGRVKRVARGVLLAFGIALCFMPHAGSTNANENKQYVSYKEYALHLLHYDYEQYKCLAILYGKESAWNPRAVNGSHYGIPQGNSEWLKDQDGYTQVRWGLSYIEHRYLTPCNALDHWKAKNWH
jgi:hypothetical protein